MNYYLAIYENIFPVSFLTNDGTFEEIRGISLADIGNLKIFPSSSSAERFIKGNVINHKGKSFEAFASVISFGEPYIRVESYRTEKPEKSFFTKENVRNAILKGNDSLINLLVVDKNANVLLINEKNDKRDYPVINGEYFSAGNGYVGAEAAQDDEFIQNEYERLLLAWEHHLNSGGSTIQAEDYYQKIDVEKTIKNIEKIIKEKY